MSESVLGAYGVAVGDLLATIRRVVLDPEDEYHKAPKPEDSLADLLEDLDGQAETCAGRPVADLGELAAFVAVLGPVKFATDERPTDAVGYVRPDQWATDRDGELLVLAALQAWRRYVPCEESAAHWLAAELSAQLWLSTAETGDVRRMVDAICTAIDARWVRRGKGDVSKGAGIMAVKSVSEFASDFAVAFAAGDYVKALGVLDQAGKAHPGATLPGGATWDKLRVVVSAKLAEATEPALVEVASPLAAVQAAVQATGVPSGAPQAALSAEAVAEIEQAEAAEAVRCAAAVIEEPDPAPEQATEQADEQDESLPVLLVEHTQADGTRLLNGPRGDVGKRISRIMGKDGQKWWFFANFWYVRASRGVAPDLARIGAAVAALEADGFTVKRGIIETTDAAGVPLPVTIAKAKVSTAQQRKVDDRRQAIAWNLTTPGGLPCVNVADCDAKELHTDTARIVDDAASGMPVAKCLPCADGTGEVPDAEAQAPVLRDSRPARKPAAKSEVKPAATKSAATKPAATRSVRLPAPESAPADGPLADIPMNVLLAMVKAKDLDAQAELLRRMSGPVVVEREVAKPASRARRVAAPKAETAPKSRTPKAEPLLVNAGPLEIAFDVAADAHPRHTARELRSALGTEVTSRYGKAGVEIHVYMDKRRGTLTVTVTIVRPTQRLVAEIAERVREVGLSVRGVVEQESVNA